MNEQKVDNKKNSKGIVIALSIAIIIILGLVGYICYDKGLIFSDANSDPDINNSSSNTTEDKDLNNDTEDIPTDMNKVTEELASLEKFITYRYNKTSDSGVDLVSESNKRLDLVKTLLANTQNTTDGQAAYISKAEFEQKYTDIYGNNQNLENDINLSTATNFGSELFNISSDYVVWNATWGTTSIKRSLKANNISYDENKQEYKITGNYKEVDELDGSTSEGNFEITYFKNSSTKYIKSIILTTVN